MKFLNKYNNPKNIRFKSFEKTFKICLERNHKTIVETGTARGKTKFFFIRRYNWKDGMSTPMFGEYAKYVNGTLHTCDISEENINNARSFTKNYVDFIKFYVNDSLIFLKEFRGKEAQEKLLGKWIIEFAEMSAVKKADNETIKSL